MEKIFNSRIIMKHDSTANWNAAMYFIPKSGEIIVYDDYETKIINGKETNIPNFKIGDGLAYCIDLPWVNQSDRDRLQDHINNSIIHITQDEREFWNNKIRNYDDPEDENLIFTTL